MAGDIHYKNWLSAMDQACRTTAYYLDRALDTVREEGVDPWEHPEVVAAMITAAASDFNHAVLAVKLQEIRDAMPGELDLGYLVGAVDGVAEALEGRAAPAQEANP